MFQSLEYAEAPGPARKPFPLNNLLSVETGPNTSSLDAAAHVFGRRFSGRLEHVVEEPFEIFESSRWNDDGVPTPIDIFRDPQKTSSRVLLQSEDKGLSLDLNLVRLECFFNDRGLRAR